MGWSPDGTRLATGGDDGVVRVWDPVAGVPVVILAGHDESVDAVGWSPDGTRLATGGDGGVVRVWDPAAGVPVVTWLGRGRVRRGGVVA